MQSLKAMASLNNEVKKCPMKNPFSIMIFNALLFVCIQQSFAQITVSKNVMSNGGLVVIDGEYVMLGTMA